MPYSPYTPTWNNPYVTSNPYGQSQYQPTAQPMTYQQPVNGVIKVNGRDSAMQYQLPPNSTSPALFDNGGTCFYIVSTDGTGTKSIECFDFSPHKDEPPVQIDGAQFVSRREFDEFAAKVNAVLGAANGVHGPVQQSTTDTAQGKDVNASPNDAGRPLGIG